MCMCARTLAIANERELERTPIFQSDTHVREVTFIYYLYFISCLCWILHDADANRYTFVWVFLFHLVLSGCYTHMCDHLINSKLNISGIFHCYVRSKWSHMWFDENHRHHHLCCATIFHWIALQEKQLMVDLNFRVGFMYILCDHFSYFFPQSEELGMWVGDGLLKVVLIKWGLSLRSHPCKSMLRDKQLSANNGWSRPHWNRFWTIFSNQTTHSSYRIVRVCICMKENFMCEPVFFFFLHRSSFFFVVVRPQWEPTGKLHNWKLNIWNDENEMKWNGIKIFKPCHTVVIQCT